MKFKFYQKIDAILKKSENKYLKKYFFEIFNFSIF